MPRKVILIGDSAGGNLVAALTAKIIKTGGVKAPDGLVMAYPGKKSLFKINKFAFIKQL